jgi:hypothetical protein
MLRHSKTTHVILPGDPQCVFTQLEPALAPFPLLRLVLYVAREHGGSRGDVGTTEQGAELGALDEEDVGMAVPAPGLGHVRDELEVADGTFCRTE